MKAYTIAMFIFSLNMCFAIFTNAAIFSMSQAQLEFHEDGLNYTVLGIDNKSAGIAYDSELMNMTGEFQNYSPGGVDDLNIFSGIGMLAQVFWRSTIGLPSMMQNLGVPVEISWLVSACAWFVYLYGLIQFLTARSGTTIQ